MRNSCVKPKSLGTRLKIGFRSNFGYVCIGNVLRMKPKRLASNLSSPYYRPYGPWKGFKPPTRYLHVSAYGLCQVGSCTKPKRPNNGPKGPRLEPWIWTRLLQKVQPFVCNLYWKPMQFVPIRTGYSACWTEKS